MSDRASGASGVCRADRGSDHRRARGPVPGATGRGPAGHAARQHVADVADQRHGARDRRRATASCTSEVTSPRCVHQGRRRAPVRWRRNRIAAFNAEDRRPDHDVQPQRATRRPGAVDVSLTARSCTWAETSPRSAALTRNRIAAFTTCDRSAPLLGATAQQPRLRHRCDGARPSTSAGSFTQRRRGRPAQRVAALDADHATRLRLARPVDNVVYDIALSQDGAKLYLAGGFLSINGDTTYHSPRRGRRRHWCQHLPSRPDGHPRREPGLHRRAEAPSAPTRPASTSAQRARAAAASTAPSRPTSATARSSGRASASARPRRSRSSNGLLYTGSHAHDCSGDRASTRTPSPRRVGPRPVPASPRTQHLERRVVHLVPEHQRWAARADLGRGRWAPTAPSSSSAVSSPGERCRPAGLHPLLPVHRRPWLHPPGRRRRWRLPGTAARSPSSCRHRVDIDDPDLIVRLYRDGGSTPIATAPVRSLFWNQPVAGLRGQRSGGRHQPHLCGRCRGGERHRTSAHARRTRRPSRSVGERCRRTSRASTPTTRTSSGGSTRPAGPAAADSSGSLAAASSPAGVGLPPGGAGGRQLGCHDQRLHGFVSSSTKYADAGRLLGGGVVQDDDHQRRQDHRVRQPPARSTTSAATRQSAATTTSRST